MKKKMVDKKIFLLLIFSIAFIISGNSVLAECNLNAEVVNQDPYPALPGDYVEVLFQINGIGGECPEGAVADIVLEYPFSLDTGDRTRILRSSTYVGYGYNSNWNVLYKLRVDPDAIEGDYEVEFRYKGGEISGSGGYSFERFNITVEDGQTDFEIHVQDYNIKERNIVFEILNVGNQDIEALTVELPKQDHLMVKGSNRNIVGDLDSNEYTTADFEAIPAEGELLVTIYYTDSTNERRMISKLVEYDPDYFIDSLENTEPSKTTTYVVLGIIVILIGFFFYRRHKKKKNKKKNKFEI